MQQKHKNEQIFNIIKVLHKLWSTKCTAPNLQSKMCSIKCAAQTLHHKMCNTTFVAKYRNEEDIRIQCAAQTCQIKICSTKWEAQNVQKKCRAQHLQQFFYEQNVLCNVLCYRWTVILNTERRRA